MPLAFELRDVVKRYGRQSALGGVTLEGHPGELLGLLGPNGAGKTTAIKCLTGLVRPSSGRALIGGVDASQPGARRRLGYLPERPRYEERLSGSELLDREGRIFGLSRGERRARAAELLERVALAVEVAERRVGTTSKGERARLGIALALMGRPQVVLLDEPTDGLDPLGRKAVRELLLSLRDEGHAVLLNSHLLAEVEACCDRLVILKAGAVVASGTTAELLARRRIVYQLRVAAEPAADVLEVLEVLRGEVLSVKADGATLEVTLSDAAQLDGVVDRLREHGVGIRELRAAGSLEDVFIDLVSDGEGS